MAALQLRNPPSDKRSTQRKVAASTMAVNPGDQELDDLLSLEGEGPAGTMQDTAATKEPVVQQSK